MAYYVAFCAGLVIGINLGILIQCFFAMVKDSDKVLKEREINNGK